MRLVAFFGCLLLAASAHAEGEPKAPATTHEAEALILFQKLCTASLGKPTDAQPLLAQFSMEGTAEKLDAAKALALTGHASKEVWLLRGPTTLQPLLLDYTDSGCALSVNDADMTGIRKEFGETIQRFAADHSGRILAQKAGDITSDMAEDRAEVGLRTGEVAILSLTARARPENDTQHMLRFELKGKGHE